MQIYSGEFKDEALQFIFTPEILKFKNKNNKPGFKKLQ